MKNNVYKSYHHRKGRHNSFKFSNQQVTCVGVSALCVPVNFLAAKSFTQIPHFIDKNVWQYSGILKGLGVADLSLFQGHFPPN